MYKLVTVQQYIESLKQNHIIDSKWQRLNVWSQGLETALITSLIKNIPIGPIYYATIDNTHYSFDGKQRSLALLNIINNKTVYSETTLPKGLKEFAIDELEQKSFSTFPTEYREKIINAIIPVWYEQYTQTEAAAAFRLINSAGEKVNEEEKRNSINPEGVVNSIKKRLSINPYWNNIYKDKALNRMKAEQFINNILFLIVNNRVQDRNKGLAEFVELHETSQSKILRDSESMITLYIEEIKQIMPEKTGRTRLSSETHQYTLFHVVHKVLSDGYNIDHEKAKELLTNFQKLLNCKNCKDDDIILYKQASMQSSSSAECRRTRYTILRNLLNAALIR